MTTGKPLGPGEYVDLSHTGCDAVYLLTDGAPSTDDFKKVVSANLVAVYVEGMSDMQKELADMQKWDMKSFAISDYKVTPAGPDTCVTTYKVAIEGTYDGKDQTGTYNAASVWKKNKGGWQAIFHTNVKQAPAGG